MIRLSKRRRRRYVSNSQTVEDFRATIVIFERAIRRRSDRGRRTGGRATRWNRMYLAEQRETRGDREHRKEENTAKRRKSRAS